jgi:hypothetical protein
MVDAASRWALFASLAIHVGALTLSFGRTARSSTQKATLIDFWAGSTFEVPEHLGDLAWESPAAAAFESASEIRVEGVDTSGSTRSTPDPGSSSAATPTAAATATSTATANPTDDTAPPPVRAPRGKAAKGSHARAEARAAASAHASAASAGSEGSASSGAFGAEVAAAGVRDLVRSFVRAIPIVASSDPVWATLPLGAAGSADLTLGMNGEGKPFAAEPLETATPAHLRRLVHKTLSVMAGGRFAVPTSDLPAAEQKLRIAIALTQQEPPADRDVASGGAFGLRFEPADARHVSRAFFTLASGRCVEVSVRQLSRH